MKGITIILTLFLFASCGSEKTEFSSPEEWEEYVNDPENGFITKKESSDLNFEIKFTPALKDEKNPQCTVQLRINRKDGGSVLDFGGVSKQEALEREGYLSFEVLKQVSIEENGHATPAIFHHYERNYGLKPSVDMYFNFMNVEPKQDVYFVYRDELFGQGLIRIKLEKELFTKCYVENA